MPSLKRRNPGLGLERRVRPRVEQPDSEEDIGTSDEASHPSIASESDDSQVESDSSGEEEQEDNESDASWDEDATPAIDTSQVSFGALAKAQASLPTAKRRATDSSTVAQPRPDRDPEKPRGKSSGRAKPKGPSSKNAPTEVSSKKPVPRKRAMIENQKAATRDPRFGPAGAVIDEAKARKAYSFLEEYRDDELGRLRAIVKKTKDPAAKEELQKQVMSMESRKKAQQRRDRERAVINEHRRQEKEKIKQGKQPFYLKRSEQKKRLLLDQYAGMSEKKVDKLLARKRKKVAGKEKKNLPMSRRGAAEP